MMALMTLPGAERQGLRRMSLDTRCCALPWRLSQTPSEEMNSRAPVPGGTSICGSAAGQGLGS